MDSKRKLGIYTVQADCGYLEPGLFGIGLEQNQPFCPGTSLGLGRLIVKPAVQSS